MERITKQVDLISRELQVGHGVGILRRKLESNEYEYVMITTPKGHTSHHQKRRALVVDDEQEQVRKLVKRIMTAENGKSFVKTRFN